MSINGTAEARAAMTTSLDWAFRPGAMREADAWLLDEHRRKPRQHRRLHDGATLYDPETGMRAHDVRATHDPRTWLAASK